MICSRCKKRPAVVFITRMENGQTLNDGLCLFCAVAHLPLMGGDHGEREQKNRACHSEQDLSYRFAFHGRLSSFRLIPEHHRK